MNRHTPRFRARTALRVLRTSVVGALLAVTAVVVEVPVSQAANVPCNAPALVSAVGAVASSGGTVSLTPGCTYTLNTVTNTADGPNAFATIVGGVTIVGNGATIARSSAALTADFRFFIIDSNGDLTLNNLTLSNGSIPSGEVHGGGAIINRDHLTVTGVTFLRNHSMGGSGGGAIDNHDLGVLSVSNSTFDSNVALQGGAIEDEATLCHISIPVCGNATISNSTFVNNSTTNFGGGALESQLDTTTGGSPPICGTQPASSVPVECQEVGGAHDTLTGDTLSGNTAAGEGGGIANFGTTTVLNSTITGNTAGTAGGGGVQNTGTITFTDSTIAANASPFGADIHVYTDVTHQPGQTTVTMSIVAAGSTANCSTGTGAPAITDGGYNIDSAASCGFSSLNHSVNGINPKLTPLASNGGPTQTMALQAGSPAIDAGPSTCTPNNDQRGAPRPQGPACDVGAFEVYTVPPTIPTGLAANANGGHEIDLGWIGSTSPIGVAGYDISREGTKIATVSGTTLSYADKGLTDATTYHYTVDSFDAVGNTSNQSTQASATTPDVTAPSVPTGLHANAVGGHEIDLSWTASTDNVGVTGYTIYRGGSALTTVVGTTYADTSVTDATMYTYTVDAFDAAGNHSAQSISASATTLDVTAPSVPTGLHANAVGGHEIDLSWSASTDNVGVTGYTIYRGASVLTTVVGTSYADKSVGDGTMYTYTVDAFDAASNHSAQSTPASATTPDITPPTTPTGLTANATPTESDLSWTASTDNVGVTGYDIFRDGTKIGQVGGSTTTYADKTTVQGHSYSYTVDAFDAAGNHSAQSAAATVNSPDTIPPSIPTGLAANAVGGHEIDLSWSASTDNVGVTGYTIYRGGSVLTTVVGTSYADKSVSDGTMYTYTVDAFDAAGNHSNQSSSASATTPDLTPPTVPSGLAATTTTKPSVTLTWKASTDSIDGVSGYDIYRGGTLLATVSGTTLTYTDNSVAQLTNYSYTVDAFDGAGNHSAQSAALVVGTPDSTPPSIPTGLTATATTVPSVVLKWNASSDNVGVAGYTIYRNGSQLTTVSGGTLTYTDSAVNQTTAYTYTIDAFDAAGNHSGQSAPVPVLTATELYFAWYDNASPGVNAETIHITNPNSTTAVGTISLSGAPTISFSVPAGQDRYYAFPHGTIGGPVLISSMSGRVIASLRSWYYQSFNETPARTAKDAATTLYLPWYDLSSPGMYADTIHITNPGQTAATGTISLPGATPISINVAPGQDSYYEFPGGTIGGPVTIAASVPVLAALRAWYYQSFNETMARPESSAATSQYFPWYDLQSPGMRAETIHITNESGANAAGSISLPGASPISFSVLSGHDSYFAFPGGTSGGPVTITSSSPVLASLRAWYYQSFNETAAHPAAAAATTLYLPWYDLQSPGMEADTIHITNESGTTATGTIMLPGSAAIPFTVLPGQDLYFEFPAGTIGGPVTITSNQAVIASLRAWYYQSFNEVPASS